jgi:hypothetical protein
MIQQGIEAITQLARQTMERPLVETVKELYDGEPVDYQRSVKATANGRELGDQLKPFRPASLEVSTLTGFIDAIAAQVAGDLVKKGRVIHVESYLNVAVKSNLCDVFGIRDTLIKAIHKPIDAFHFDVYYNDPAKFIIGLQVAFLTTDNLLNLIKLASNLKTGSSVQVADDGFSQTVTLKEGEVSAQDVKIPPRLKLIPIRTFSEAPPVESEFLVRFQQTQQQTTSIALFNVDGTRWQSETMLSIKRYLEKHVKDVPILA